MEERLTKKVSGCFCYDLKDHKNVPGEFASYDAFFDYSMAVKRLGEYEDTGLDPEEVAYFLGTTMSVKEAKTQYAEHKKRYDEWFAWKQAEQDGRLLVLPCKVGEKFYYNFLGKTYEGKLTKVVYHEAGVQVYFADYDGDNASRRLNEVFKTREEAEAALKEREGK